HPYPGVELLPAHAKLTPVFEMGVAATHSRQLIARPLVGPVQVGRTGKARANAIRQSGCEVHHMGMSQPFVANALIHGVVETLCCRLRQFVRWFVSFGRRSLPFLVGGGGKDGQRQDKAKKQSKSDPVKLVESHVSVSL